MTIQSFAALACIAASTMTVAACDRAPTLAAGGDCAEALATATREVDSTATARGIPGGYVLVMRDGQVVCNHHFGNASTRSHVPIASASKWLTAITLLTLVDDGKLSLDEPVGAMLPEFTGPRAGITLRQLLSHTSGIPSSNLCLVDPGNTLEQCTLNLAYGPLANAPGTQFRYGSGSFHVAGRLAEIATGQRWNELFRDRVSGPLGIPFTGWFGGNPLLAAGGWSTGDEYARVLRMVADHGSYGGRRILSDTAIALMSANSIAGAAMAATPRTDTYGYGLGAWRDAVDANGVATQISSPGASGFYPWVDFQRNVVGIVWLPSRGPDDGYWFAATQKVQAVVRHAYDAGEL